MANRKKYVKVDPVIDTKIQLLVDSLIRLAEANYRRTFAPINIRYYDSSRTAGWANYGTRTIEFHVTFMTENWDEYCKRTVPHEVAHILAYEVYGDAGRGHKRHWKHMMRVLGAKDMTRCHSYSTKSDTFRKLKRFIYKCSCKEHKVATRTHNKIQRRVMLADGDHGYKCQVCRTKVNYTGKMIKV